MFRIWRTVLKRFAWILPTLLVGLAATRWTPIAAPATFLLLCCLPGQLVVRLTKLGENWDIAGRAVLSIAFSLAVTPVLLNPVWHVTNDPWALLAYVWVLIQTSWWLSRRSVRLRPSGQDHPGPVLHLFDRGSTKLLCAALAGLVAFATIGTYWPTELKGYPIPALIHDFVKHHAVLFSLEQQPLPLTNVFYGAGPAGPVYYYHFFYLIPATLRAVAGGVSIELAFGLQSALVGVTTAGMFYLIVKRFTGGDGPASLAALLCTAIGSLDIVPILVRGVPVITLDAWADHVVRIHNFLNQMIWSPQNVSGVVILLVGVYTLSRKGWWRGWFILGPLLGAALVGSTVWVSMAAFAGVGCYLLVEALSHCRQPTLAVRRLAAGGVVGLLALAAGAPSLLGYSEMSRRIGKGLTTEWPHQSNALLGKLVSPGIFANLLDLPWVLALELGPLILFPLLLPRQVWRRAWNDAGLRLLLISAVAAVAGFVTFRSHFTVNDFGQKTMLVAMAAGVVLAGALLQPSRTNPAFLNPLGWSLQEQRAGRRRTKTAVFVAVMLLAGLPVGLYEAPLTAIRRYLPQSGPLGRFTHPISRRAAEEARAYQFLRYGLPANAILQPHWGTERLNLVQIARRRLGVTVLEMDTMVFHPADAAAHERCLRQVSECLAKRGPAERCHDALRGYGITHVFVGWAETEAWQGLEKFDDRRYFRPVFDDGRTRVLALE